MAVVELEKGGLAVSLAECKAYLRLERDDEDAVLAGMVRTAMALCEAFVGEWLLIREGEQRLEPRVEWQRLAVQPVRTVVEVRDGDTVLPVDGWAAHADAGGTVWVRLAALGTAPVVRFRAGMAADWNGIPEALRHGIVRLAVHLFTHRDAADAGPPPAAVAALWRPWRRMPL